MIILSNSEKLAVLEVRLAKVRASALMGTISSNTAKRKIYSLTRRINSLRNKVSFLS